MPGYGKHYPEEELMATPDQITAYLRLDDCEGVDEALENTAFATWVDQNCGDRSLHGVVDGINEQSLLQSYR